MAGNRARRLVSSKMAENSIAKELLDEIDVFVHTRVARHIPRSSEISLRYFEDSGLAREYFLDLDDVFLKNKRKPLKFVRRMRTMFLKYLASFPTKMLM